MKRSYLQQRKRHNKNRSCKTALTLETLEDRQLLTTVTISPATFIDATTADVSGQVTDDGGDTATVTIYYGDNDGGTSAAAWDDSILLGQQPGPFGTTLDDLAPSTTYFYRADATNQSGTVWTASAESFTTLTVFLPTVANLPATGVGAFTATLGGDVSSTGNDSPEVTIFYGDEDGGTDAATWDSSVTLGGKQSGPFSTQVIGLNANTTYFYTARVTNLAGDAWAAPAESFNTTDVPPLVISETVSDNGTLETRTRTSTGVPFAGPQTTPDWLEIHNSDAGTFDISGMHLTDDANDNTKWTFPAGTTIPGNGYLVVFASNEDILDPQLDEQGKLHTNFRLNSAGEYVALTDSAGNVIHQLDLPTQFRDVSYGLDPNFEEFYFDTPTPESANTEGQLAVKDTNFSVDRGFYSDPFTTEITTATADATIIYTLDGTPPSATAQGVVTNGTIYSGPLAIDETTTLRAMAFRAGLRPTDVDTHTYIFPADVLQQSDADVQPHENWGENGDPDWAMDSEVVNLPDGDPNKTLASDLTAIPTVSLVMNWDEMFGTNGIYVRGEGVRRATSFEYIDPATGESAQADGSVAIQGGSSPNRTLGGDWKSPKLSMRVRFTSQFGDTKLNYPVFGDDATSSFDGLELDAQLNYVWHYSGGVSPANQQNNALYIHDLVTADLHNAVTGETQSMHGRYAHVYINGIYWGMHTLHERPDESWAAEYFGGDKDEYHAINQNRSINDGLNPDGTPSPTNAAVTSLNAMVSVAQAAGNGGLAEWQAVQEVLDVDQFIDYLLVNWYTGNGDWGDTKNWYASAKNSPDGRWRFHSWDAEKAFENFNSGGRADVGVSAKNLHQALDGNEEYMIAFADRIHEHLFYDGLLTPDNAASIFRARVDEVESAIRAESARWGDSERSSPFLRADLMDNYDAVFTSFFPGRTEKVLDELRDKGVYPEIGAPVYQLNGADQHGGQMMAGDSLTMTASAATITTDTVLVEKSADVKAFIPADGSLESGASRWYDTDFDTAGWITGTGVVGFGSDFENRIGLNVQDEWNASQSSVYVRYEFDLDAGFNASDIERLNLDMKFDDGFVVYVNGQEIHSDSAPAAAAWDSRATATQSNFVHRLVDIYESFNLADAIGALRPGQNVLAIRGLTHASDLDHLLVGAELTMSDDVGVAAPIVYTLDGTDPRAAGGANVGITYDGAIPLNGSTQVNARAFVGGQWSALSSATFVIPPTSEDVVITEINYNPSDPMVAELDVDALFVNDDFDFIEVHNANPDTSFNLLGTTLANGVEFDFPSVSLAPGEYAVVVENTAAFQARYGNDILVLGEWSGGLANGETIELVDGLGNRLVELDFRNGDPWAERANGFGATLELVDPSNTSTSQLGKHYSWQGSANVGGTPGATSTQLTGVVVNEVLARTTNTSEVDAIELFNPTSQAVEIGGWYLSDSGNDLLKYEIPLGTMLAAGDYLVIDALQFGAGDSGFALSGTSGDDVWLVKTDGNGGVGEFVDDVHFGASHVLTTLGRVPDGTGRFSPLGRNTLGCENTHASVGPMIISEVNFNPGDPSDAALQVFNGLVEDDLEFVEVYNPTAASVDLTQWRLRGGTDYNFDAATTLAAGEAIVIISFDPDDPVNADRVAGLQEHYGIDNSVRLVGGYAGELSDSGEAVRILRPGTPPDDDPTTIPRTTDDEVLYDDLSPWHPSSDGGGDSLQRMAPSFFGSAASSWDASDPTPGTVAFGGNVEGDFTGDGIVTAADIDVLLDAVNDANTTEFYDLNASGTVTSEDVDYLVENVLGTFTGDANLDGRVDAVDLNAVGVNWQRTETCLAWADGNFNGDHIVDAVDLNILGINWQAGIAAAAANVPRAPLASSISPVVVDAALRVDAGYGDSEGSPAAIASTSAQRVDARQPEVILRRWSDHSLSSRYSAVTQQDLLRPENQDAETKSVDELLAAWK